MVASITTEEVDARISELTTKADSIYEEVVGGIDAPLSSLLRAEAEYRDTVLELNTLLGVRDAYTTDPLPTPDEDLSELLAKQSSLEVSIQSAGYYEDIGSLDYYPVIGQPYKVNSSFGSRYDPTGIRGQTFHYGVDLKAPEGTPIGAWFSGTVIEEGYSYGSGNYIWLDHGSGVKTFYCHLSRIDVERGQRVTQGTQIALSGNTGKYTTGPHLHMGLYIDGTAVDPRVILG